ncbi:uncharacterized protein LOC132735901, partial [Ruditapes philippinarum]|uniref:uncharacterized protein LOC132735901 n=1 Tax=Ruditapes philippinarum TaxID=129788 RepID=UPI00295B616D
MVISQFADDSSTWKSGSNLVKLAKDAQAGMDSLWGWAQKWGFKISETKTVGIVFGNQKKHNLNVSLGGTPINFVKTVRFLGLLLDEKLTFGPHIKDLVNRCKKDLNVMRMLKGTDFGTDKNSLLLLYKSLIRSKIDYGAQIYSCAKKTHLNKLDTVQNTALRLALGALYSTPARDLEMEAGIVPLSIRRKSQTLKYYTRVRASAADNPVRGLLGKGHYKLNRFKDPALPFGAATQDLAEDCGIKDSNIVEKRPMEVPPWTLTLPEVDITLQEKVNKSDLPHLANTETKILINKYIGQTHIYTDGSKDPDSGRVASAVVIPSIQYKKIDRLTNNTSIYTAELLAIRNAMCWIHDSDITKAVIFSDSLSSLISLKSNNSQSRPDLLNEIILLYNKVLNLGKQVTIVWCPAHIGISGNEQADRAAKMGLNLNSVTESISLSPTEIYSKIKKYIVHLWQTESNSCQDQRKHINSSVGLSHPVQYSNNLKIDRAITRLRLGTTLLPGDSGQYIKKMSPNCAQCGVRYNISHLLHECDQFRDHRNELRSALGAIGLGYSTKNILNPPKKDS